MRQILVAVSLACTMALVESDCPFANPCGATGGSRVSCGPSGISKFPCLWLGCCYEETSGTGSCFEKVSICEARDNDMAILCSGPNTVFLGRSECELGPGETCGIGTMTETLACDDQSGSSMFPLRHFERCCCTTPCGGANRCGIPTGDRTVCVDGSAQITTEAGCFAAHCCFEDGATVPCFEPNSPPETTCDMVYPGCETP